MSKDKRDIPQEARDRFRGAESAEMQNRTEGLEDLKFYNGEQWPAKIRREREKADRPCETINKLPGHGDHILGEIRQNKISIKIKPTGKPSSVEVAKIYEGLIRSIENLSRSDTVYKTGAEGAIVSGRGAWRVITDYVDDDVFDQEIRLKRIKNPYTVYFDPSAEEWDKRDGTFAFITEWLHEDEYKRLYPDADVSNYANAGIGDSNQKLWFHKKMVRVAEYFVKEPTTKTIHLLSDGRVVDDEYWQGEEPKLKAKEEIHWADPSTGVLNVGEPPEGVEYTVINEVPTIERSREVETHKVVSYILNGIGVISGPHEWAGKYIPIIPCWGKELNIDGVDHVRGQFRFSKGPQRLYNYERNAEIERVALAKIPPVRLTPEQIEGHEHMWNSDENLKYQLYNYVPSHPEPRDISPPQVSSGNVAQSAIAADEIKQTTTVYDASLGAKGPEKSGIAIARRVRQGSIANYPFLDNLVRSITFTGEILVDLIPKIYDTERALIILGEDGEPSDVTVNEDKEGNILNNLTVGKYMVTVTVGPHYATKREETAQNLINIAGVVPTVGQLGGDIIVHNLDFEGASVLAERIKRTIPPQILDEDGPQDDAPDLEAVEQKVEIEGLQLDNALKKLELTRDSLELRQFFQDSVKGAAAGAVQEVLQRLGVLQPPTGGGNAG